MIKIEITNKKDKVNSYTVGYYIWKRYWITSFKTKDKVVKILVRKKIYLIPVDVIIRGCLGIKYIINQINLKRKYVQQTRKNSK